MTKKDRKRYSREFKLEAVRRSFESGKPTTEVARELDISVYELYRWRDLVTKEGKDVFPGRGNKDPQDELAVLRKENRRLREERDILKKSLGFFAREQEQDTSLSGSTD